MRLSGSIVCRRDQLTEIARSLQGRTGSLSRAGSPTQFSSSVPRLVGSRCSLERTHQAGFSSLVSRLSRVANHGTHVRMRARSSLWGRQDGGEAELRAGGGGRPGHNTPLNAGTLSGTRRPAASVQQSTETK